MADDIVDSQRFYFEFGQYGTLGFEASIDEIRYVGGGTVEVDISMEKVSGDLGGTDTVWDLYIDGDLVDSYSTDTKYIVDHTMSGDGSMGSNVKVEFYGDLAEARLDLSGVVPTQDAEVIDVSHGPSKPVLADINEGNLKNTITIRNNKDMSHVLFDVYVDTPHGDVSIDEVDFTVDPNSESSAVVGVGFLRTALGVDELSVGEYEFCVGGKCTSFSVMEKEGDWPGWEVEGMHYDSAKPSVNEDWQCNIYLSNTAGFDIHDVNVGLEFSHVEGLSNSNVQLDIPVAGTKVEVPKKSIIDSLGLSSIEEGDYTVCVGD